MLLLHLFQDLLKKNDIMSVVNAVLVINSMREVKGLCYVQRKTTEHQLAFTEFSSNFAKFTGNPVQ